MKGSNAHRSRDCSGSCRVRDNLYRGDGWIDARIAEHRPNHLRSLLGNIGIFTCEEETMILYSKRTTVNVFPDADVINPRIAYIYWDFGTGTGGHLDKDKNIIPRQPNYLRFHDLASFHRWRTTFKDYWEEPTQSIIEDYLQVDEGL